MRNYVLSAMLFAFGSIVSTATPCAVGPVNLATMTSSCTFGDWTLGGFGLEVPSLAFGYSSVPVASNFMVQVGAAPVLSGYGIGLAVSFTPADGGPNFLTANSGNPNQVSSFKTLFSIDAGPIFAQSLISADVATVSNGNNGMIVVQAGTQDPSLSGSPTFADATILTVSNAQSENPIALNGFAGNTRSQFSVSNAIQISAGSSGSAAMNGFTNLFYLPVPPPSEVPEPMTFTLIGGGLIAVTLLRRR